MSTLGTVVSPLLVGRDDLLALGDRRIADVAGGTGHLLLLAGEAGIGKSRLLRTLLKKAIERGFRVAGGSLGPHDSLATLAAIMDLARDMRESDFGELGARLLAVDRAQGPDALGSRRRLVRDTVDLMSAAIDRPTVFAFEDLQWADTATLEVIGELARVSAGLPLMIVGAHRLDELPAGSAHREWRARAITQRLAEEVKLQRLTRDETALVTTLLLGTGLPAPREVSDAVHARTNGIPLHIEELLAAVGNEATDGHAILGSQVPETIEDAILAHAGRLSSDARAIARAGAVLGRCFAPEVVAGILDRPVSDLDAPLDELVRDGILYPFEFIDQGYYDFRHQLMRDALYDDVPATDLRRFHARAAEFGATLIGASEIHASLHFERAGLREKAFKAALTAADAATKVYSNREAFDLYARAIHNLPPGLPDGEQARVWVAYSNAGAALDRNDICRDAAERARDLAVRAGDPVTAARALLNLCSVARREAAPIAERRDLGRRSMIEIEAIPDSSASRRLRVDCLEFLGLTETDALDYATAQSYFEEQRDLATAAGTAEAAASASGYLQNLEILQTGSPEALSQLVASADEARAAGHETHAVNTYRDAAYYAVRSLDYRGAGSRIIDGLQYAEEIEQSFCGHILASLQAIVSWAEGRWDDAILEAGQAVSDPGSSRAHAYAAWALGWTKACRGDLAGAEEALRPALELGLRADWLELILPAQWGLAEAFLASGDPAAAIDICERSLSAARQRGEHGLLVPFVVTGVRAHQAAGRPDAASKWLGQVVRAIGPLAGVAAPAIEHATGLVRLAEGSITASRQALENAIVGWDERGRRWEALWARLDLAAADLRANRYAEAMALIREVEDAAGPLDSQPLLDRAAQLARVARGRGAELDAWHPLTVREFEVARKIAEGLTNAAIADALFVSPKTISAHVEHILAKLGASRRAEIASWVSGIAQPVA